MLNLVPADAQPIGYRALVEKYNLKIIPHYRWSFIIAKGERRTVKDHTIEIHFYQRGYALKNPNDPFEHLEFAFRHEGVNLEIIKGLCGVLTTQEIIEYIKQSPQGKYSRRFWYLYELFTNTTLPLQDLTYTHYINLLDETEYCTAKPIKSSRHKVNDNLLGNSDFCPLVRKTRELSLFEEKHLEKICEQILQKYDASVIARASRYLYTKETKSSYEIEREQPDKVRLARFVQLLENSQQSSIIDKKQLITLQNAIVDKRFIEPDYRTLQNYIGDNSLYNVSTVHYISPKADDVAALMEGLLKSLERMIESKVHPVVIAGAISFGFVFIHPFEDGNGRLHRFLIHAILAKTQFVPEGLIFPISATILKNIKKYDEALERFSKPLLASVGQYELTDEGKLLVEGNQKSFYQYIDYTPLVEFLFDCIEETIHTDFKRELDYIAGYDKTRALIVDKIDMPDKLLNLFIRLVVQNKGTLSAEKRESFFSMLTDDEIKELEGVIQRTLMAEEH